MPSPPDDEDGDEWIELEIGPVAGDYSIGHPRTSGSTDRPGSRKVADTPEGYKIQRAQQDDRVRLVTAISIGSVFGLTVVLSFLVILVRPSSAWTNAKGLLQIILPAETTLLAGVLGFYFGERSRTNRL